MEMVKEPKKPKLLLLVLIQIQKLVIESQEPGAVHVIHQPKNLELLVIVEQMPLMMTLRHLLLNQIVKIGDFAISIVMVIDRTHVCSIICM